MAPRQARVAPGSLGCVAPRQARVAPGSLGCVAPRQARVAPGSLGCVAPRQARVAPGSLGCVAPAAGSERMHFIVMANTLSTVDPCDEVYDLKGSSVRRGAPPRSPLRSQCHSRYELIAVTDSRYAGHTMAVTERLNDRRYDRPLAIAGTVAFSQRALAHRWGGSRRRTRPTRRTWSAHTHARTHTHACARARTHAHTHALAHTRTL